MTVTTTYLASVLGRDPEALMALREVPAFHDCSGDLLELVFRYGKVVVLREGQELTREGDFDQWVFFIIKGRLDVFVGEDHVDTISSSLVGERCILGEHRRATLRATGEGVTALGLDMALLDALRDRGAAREPVAVYLELLSIIAGEVVNRIVELEFNLLDFAYKYRAHTRTEELSDILQQLSKGAYRSDRNANFAVYRFLIKHDPVALQHSVNSDGYTVDTRQLYADAVLAGNHELLYAVAEAVQRERTAARANGGAPGHSFAGFSAHIIQAIAAQHGADTWREEAAQAFAHGIHKRLRLNEQHKVNLRGLIQWLIDAHRYTAEETIDLLMTVLKESSDYTGRINGQLKSMVNELAQTRFAKELGAARRPTTSAVVDYYCNTPLEELIPFFSQNILDVYLVEPFMRRLEAADAGAWDRHSPVAEAERNGLIATLFE